MYTIIRDIRRYLKHRGRGSIGMTVGVSLPIMIVGAALGTEVTTWGLAKLDLQRSADAASVAGAINYKAMKDPQKAATAAANMAAINSAAGSNPIWNKITAQVTQGVNNTNDTALQVTIERTIPLNLAASFSSLGSVKVKATSLAENINKSPNTGGGGGQPCILGLNGDTNGVTNYSDITLGGNSNISMVGCTIRSDGGISLAGNALITTDAMYAAGSITISSNSIVVAYQYPNSGQIGDPYAAVTTLQDALTAVEQVSATSISCSGSSCTGPSNCCTCLLSICTIQPGNYGGLSLSSKANVILAAGRHVFNGNISAAGGASLTGVDVTVLMGAGTSSSPLSVSFTGGSSLSLSAPTILAASGNAISGIAFATLSTGSMSFGGNSAMPFTGVLYVPNGTVDLTGTSQAGAASATGCAQIVASIVRLGGTSTFTSTGCPAYGTQTYDSKPTTTTTTATLVR